MRKEKQTNGLRPLIVHLFGGFVLLLFNTPARGKEYAVDRAVVNYFTNYCYRCHDQASQKGDRRLDAIPSMLDSGGETALLLEEALDAINRGDMPPKEDDVVQPPLDETRRVISTITLLLSQLNDSKASPTTIMRRLNRFEYVNTMRDLLGLRQEFFATTSDFPVDATQHGFDNNGEALSLSDYQLHRYLEVARASLDAASYFGIDPPKSQEWQYRANDFNGVTSYQRAPVTWRLIVDGNYLEIGHGQPSERHPNFAKGLVQEGGVPADGWYAISIRAAAANRLNHGYEHDEFKRFQKQPLKLALWVAPNAALLDKNAADQRELVKVWDLPDETPEVFTERVWLRTGSIPFLSWTNGISSKGNIRVVAEKHHPEVIRATQTQLDAAKLGDEAAQALVAKLASNDNNPLLSDVYQGPRVRVWGMTIQGPQFEQWPPKSHRLLFGQITNAEQINIAQTIKKFAERAFRRPLTKEDVNHYVAFIQQCLINGDRPADAIKNGMTGILTSPRFLYLDEGNHEAESRLGPYELASRLSYFLWSSMPDEELLSSAASGELGTDSGLVKQVERMLDEEKSAAFVEHFTDTWLRINTLGSMPPDSKAFEAYYRDRLEDLFKRETRLFFADLLRRNGEIVNFLDSNYTFVNDALSNHYGIDGVQGEQFRKVSLTPVHRRGGLLGQGSILTLTANGIETSPVTRGVWVLENLLGSRAPSPPPDVPAIEPDTRGTTTIREQLDQHRTVTACADCHQKIDPAGFALEFFDPIGGFRTEYLSRGRGKQSVNGFGRLPSGETFNDERGLKLLLIAQKDRFTESLATKLMAYATGREMTFRDSESIKGIAVDVANKGYGLRDLIIQIARSETFKTR